MSAARLAIHIRRCVPKCVRQHGRRRQGHSLPGGRLPNFIAGLYE